MLPHNRTRMFCIKKTCYKDVLCSLANITDVDRTIVNSHQIVFWDFLYFSQLIIKKTKWCKSITFKRIQRNIFLTFPNSASHHQCFRVIPIISKLKPSGHWLNYLQNTKVKVTDSIFEDFFYCFQGFDLSPCDKQSKLQH